MPGEARNRGGRIAPVLYLVATLVAGMIAPSALACVRTTTSSGANGACLFWNKRSVPVVMNVAGTPNVSGTGAFDAIRRSENTWSNTPGSDIRLIDSGFTSDPRVGFFAQGWLNVNQVIFRARSCLSVAPAGDSCWTKGGCNNKYECWENDSGTIALTTSTFSEQCGEIYDGDVELNNADFFFTVVDSPTCPADQPAPNCVATDVQNTVTHELGHLLGLAHSTDPTAVMYASAPQGQTSKRTLAPDDILCIDTAYPAGKPTDICVQCTGSGCCGGASGLAVPWLPFAGALALAGRRRRRSTA